MAHQKHCQNCGSSFTGSINKRFCGDACRKYYKRHGETSLAGVSTAPLADKAGQVRTSPRAGSGGLVNYTAKKGIDLFAKYVEHSWQEPKKGASALTTTSTNTPLELVKASSALNNPMGELHQLHEVHFSPPFASFLGPVIYPFKLLVWGLPGSGKSTFSMKLANEIAARHSVLYVAGEEALSSPTLLNKQKRTLDGKIASRCVFVNRLPNSAKEWKQVLLPGGPAHLPTYKAIFYDSVTKLGITPFYVNAAANEFSLPVLEKSLSHIFITHAHKDGQQYRGDGSWGHEVDIIIRVEKGVATTEKNRFGEVGKSLLIY